MPSTGMEAAMKKAIFCLIHIWLFAWLANAADAYAYNEAGHYYTLLALFDSRLSNATPQESLSEIRLETFCAELPDLAQEFDAITQRTRVFESSTDYLWGLSGQCQSPVSSHMVASQYYLHGLAGTPAPALRAAARDIFASIDDELQKQGPASEQRRNLICARGLAAHLYGDSFAHVRLKSEKPGFFSSIIETEMYDTGLGHARDGHEPDYLYGHNISVDKWPEWVADAGTLIATGADTRHVLDTHIGCANNSYADCDVHDEGMLENLIHMKATVMVDMKNLLANGNTGIGNMERATTCAKVVETAFPDVGDRPNCGDTWKFYLEKAVPAFFEQGIDPTSRSKASAGKSCSAWRCRGKTSYGGESPSSCKAEITDDIKFGRDEP
jgi:hypothetical protein